jgi:hypothetical protein
LSSYATTTDARLLYECANMAGTWYEKGVAVHEGDFAAVGNDGHMLLGDLSWSELGSLESTPTAGLPNGLSASRIRGYEGGFHVVFADPLRSYRELWSIEDAEASLIGVFSDPPEGFEAKAEGLGGDDILYRIGVLDGVGVVVASSVAGASSVIHEDVGDDSPIIIATDLRTDIPIYRNP